MLEIYVSKYKMFSVYTCSVILMPCRGIIVATTQAKPVPPPSTELLRMRGGSYVFLCFPTVNPPSKIYVQYFTGLLFVQTCRVCLRHNVYFILCMESCPILRGINILSSTILLF